MAHARREDQLWTLGVWLVKTGQEEEFRSAWEGFAGWTAQSQPEAPFAYLVQDTQQPRQFYSFGPWASAEAIARWRGLPEFQAFVAKARELCDDLQPHTVRLAAEVGHRP